MNHKKLICILAVFSVFIFFISAESAGAGANNTDDRKSQKEQPLNKNSVEKVSIGSSGNLRINEIDDEQLAVSFSNGDSSLIYASDEGFTVDEYDSLMRILKKTVWKYNESGIPEKIKTFSFFYNEDNKNPSWQECLYHLENRKVSIQYSSTGKILKQVEYKISPDVQAPVDETKNSGQFENNDYEVNKNFINEYDTQGRLVGKTTISSNGGSDSITQKFVYYYTEYADQPDYDYFENDVLKIELRRQDDSVYMQMIYFDKESSVETKYIDGIKAEEVFRVNGKIIRRKKYEN